MLLCSVVELASFSILEADSEGIIPQDPDEGTENSVSIEDLSLSNRPRMFSTFQSASSPSTLGDGGEYRLRFQDILSCGINIPRTEGETPESLYLRRKAHFEFLPKCPLKNLRLLFARDLEDDAYSSVSLSKALPENIMLLPLVKISKIGNLWQSVTTQEYEQDIFLPEDKALLQKMSVFMVEGDDNNVLVKARAIFMTDCGRSRISSMDTQLMESEGRLEQTISNLSTRSAWKLYSSLELLEFIRKRRGVALPPVRFDMSYDRVLLGYRCFEPPNTDAIVANYIVFSFEQTFDEYLCATLSSKYPIRTFLVNFRGFGFSGGKRGCSPSIAQVFKDMQKIVKMVRGISDVPIIIGGFFFSAGIVLNYISWKDREAVDGIVMLSPVLGNEWGGLWREEALGPLIKEKVIIHQKFKLFISKATRGLLFGGSSVLTLKAPDDVYDINPLYVGNLSCNYLHCMHVPRSADPFKKLSIPFLMVLAENDELLRSLPMKEIVESGLNGVHSKVEFVYGQTSLGLLQNCHDILGFWIMKLPVVESKVLSVLQTVASPISEKEIEKIEAVLELSLYDSVKDCLDMGIFESPLRKAFITSKEPILYDFFGPQELPARPIGCLLMFAPRCFCSFLPTIALRYRMAIFRLDPLSINGDKSCLQSKMAAKMIENWIKLIKANYAAAPFFLGGVNAGASAIIDYANRKGKEPVNGYILVAPFADPESSQNLDFVTPIARSLAKSSVYLAYGSQGIGIPTTEQKSILEKCGIYNHFDSLTKANLSTDIVADIKSLDVPSAVILPRDDRFMINKRLYSRLIPFMNTPFKTVELRSGDVNEALRDISSSLGVWMSQLAMSISPRSMLRLIHPKLDDFQPIEMIGKGSFGKVWLVRHKRGKQFLAMKVLDKKSIFETKQEAQVLREKRVLSECSSCPFIVSYAGAFQNKRNLFLLMEFVIGGELYTRLNKLGKFPNEMAKFYVAEVLVALKFLHDRHIIYRDLKPENIVLDALGHIRLVDFGFARQLDVLGRCGSFCGSPFYIAPEMLASSQYGISADIWAIGVLIYELLVGSPPFTGRSANEVYRKILFSQADIPGGLHSDAKDLVNKLLDPCPTTRLGSKKGIIEIMKHKWFKGIDWGRVEAKQLQSPHQPQFTFEGDTVNFVKFSSSTADFEDNDEENKYEDMFQNF